MTAKAELLTQSPDGRRGAERRLQGDVSAACNSVVLAAASDRHKNYSALRGYPLREKNGCRSSRKCGYVYSKIRITFFKISISEMMILLKTKWTEMSNSISALTI